MRRILDGLKSAHHPIKTVEVTDGEAAIAEAPRVQHHLFRMGSALQEGKVAAPEELDKLGGYARRINRSSRASNTEFQCGHKITTRIHLRETARNNSRG